MSNFYENKQSIIGNYDWGYEDDCFLKKEEFYNYKKALGVIYDNDFAAELASQTHWEATRGLVFRMMKMLEIGDPIKIKQELKELCDDRQDFLNYVNEKKSNNAITPENWEKYKKNNSIGQQKPPHLNV